MVERIEALGFTPEIFFDKSGRKSLSASLSWTADFAEDIARRCHGAALIGLPRWTFQSKQKKVLLPTEYSHYEAALARTLALPMLILAQENLLRRGVFDSNFGQYIGTFPANASESWLETSEFKVPFGFWYDQLAHRRDVFLGYSGAAEPVALLVRDFLEKEIGATVLDWKRDFRPGRSILQEIEEARVRCTTGIFLFTKDDELKSSPRRAAPRDNVVFEAGYFVSSKGKDRVLIIREKGAKMPADLGGDIYAALEKRTSVKSIETTVRQFFDSL
ncbi:MAG TPA: nucleotide-binding protein [Thermoanaerobaculia bacterium]|nr:nucleotide-binding protein [Thermoanaerobaculia bacterium]